MLQLQWDALWQNLTAGKCNLMGCVHNCAVSDPHSIHRFHLIPSFGCGTIRWFSTKTSKMKKLAVWDYEDILQVGSSLMIESNLTGSLSDSAPYLHLWDYYMSPTMLLSPSCFLSCWMACTSQVKVPHGTHNTLPQVCYNSPQKATPWVQEYNMFCIPNMWASERSSCAGSTSGSEESQGIYHSILTSDAEPAIAKDCFP